MFFKKLKELKETKSLLKARTKALINAEIKVEERDKLIKKVTDENEKLRLENDYAVEQFRRIAYLISANKYNDNKVVMDKVKELVSDFQS